MSTVPGSNLQNSTSDKAEPVPPLPKSGTRGHMWSEAWKLWPWPQFSALLLQKTAATHEAAIQEVSTLANRQRRHRHQQATSRHQHTCTKANSQDTISNPLTQRQPATHATPQNSATVQPYEENHLLK
ncbi:hypothetical protein RB195_006181 [Necator americanus]|uniref:Uncharacterized protein n=1 Tax=Necator americanus TaxID=51031 RepID=A0ABR1BUR9_NECAM